MSLDLRAFSYLIFSVCPPISLSLIQGTPSFPLTGALCHGEKQQLTTPEWSSVRVEVSAGASVVHSGTPGPVGV